MLRHAFPLLVLLPLACSSPRPLESGLRGSPREASVSAPAAGGDALEANWKERLAQPYLYLEHQGDYRLLGDAMRDLLARTGELGQAAQGAPFALFFDDPGRVPVQDLRARVCLPVRERPARLGQLRYDVLPRAMVVYAEVRGPYPELPRSYPVLFSYLRELGWKAGAPIREIYLVNPADVTDLRELRAEVQIPWSAAE